MAASRDSCGECGAPVPRKPSDAEMEAYRQRERAYREKEEARIEARLAMVPTYPARRGEKAPINHAAVCVSPGCAGIYGCEADMTSEECRRWAENHADARGHTVRVLPWRPEGTSTAMLEQETVTPLEDGR